MFLSFTLMLIIYISFASNSSKSNSVILLGRELKTIFSKKSYTAFYRIPYAKPPLYELRFKPPEEHNSFFSRGTFDFSVPDNVTNTPIYNEDCLYLTIYTPNTQNRTKTFPVLVWTHEYSDDHGPDFFIDEELLVVTVSFRSSIFGFLNSGDDYAEGNMGAKDILLALKWLRHHVTLFNGDPNKITIIGSGIGATPVASMLLSPAAEDLFSRAIIMDGSALSPADYRINNLEAMYKLYWRIKGQNDKFNRMELYQILSDMSSARLLLACRNLYDSTEVRDNQRLINSFTCSIENKSKRPFMDAAPLALYNGRLKKDIDVIFGFTTLPMLYKLKGLSINRELLKYLNYNFQYLIPFAGWSDEYNSKRYKRIRREIMSFYFLNATIGERSLRRYAKYVSDQVIYPLLRQTVLHSKASRGNVYLYRFPFKGSLNFAWMSSVPNLKWVGATFGDEICYLFRCKSKTADIYKSRETSHERQFIRKIVRLFANFVKYGNPTPFTNDLILGNLQWNPLERNKELQAMNLGRTLRMMDVPEEKRMKFWDQLRNEYFTN